MPLAYFKLTDNNQKEHLKKKKRTETKKKWVALIRISYHHQNVKYTWKCESKSSLYGRMDIIHNVWCFAYLSVYACGMARDHSQKTFYPWKVKRTERLKEKAHHFWYDLPHAKDLVKNWFKLCHHCNIYYQHHEIRLIFNVRIDNRL